MRIAAYIYQNEPGVGLVAPDLKSLQPLELPPRLRALGALPVIEALSRGEPVPPAGPAIAIDQVQLTAPLPRPRRNIFCVGKNYHAHAKEFAGSGFDSSAKPGGDIPAVPIYFTKVPESVVGPGAPIVIVPEVSTAIDYEAELAVVIGQGGKGIKAADAMKHVWGYTIINDVTARDWQSRHMQWHLGKSFDTFCPMGPWLVSADECNGQRTQVRLLGQRRRAAERVDHRPDLRHSDPDRNLVRRHHALPRRRHRHRHAGRRGHRLQAAEIPQARRRGAHRDRRHRRAGEPGSLRRHTRR